MAVALYMDVHVPQAITDQLLRRGVDVLTAVDDGARTLSDEQILDRATSLKRVLFTQDIRFKKMAEDWQRTGRVFAGLVFGHQLHATIGQYVMDLELISGASDSAEWLNAIERLPLSTLP